MKKALEVLVVEDNAGDARLLREMFSKEKPGSFHLTHLLRMSEALVHLEKGGVDIVLLDMGLPDGHGLDTVRRAQSVAPGVPIIVLTGLDDEALAAEAMKEGAQDYLIKGQIESRALPRALRHAIERHRMQSETDLIRINQLQFKDNFLSHVSHELRSPLNAIYQFVTILLDKLVGELNPEQREYLDIVFRNVKQLQAMIEDLLEVTRGEGGKLTIELQRTSIEEAIAYAVNTLQGAAAAKGITLSTQLAYELPMLCADPTRVRQILIILLDNAIKFTPTNGAVKVRASVFAQDPNQLVLQVSDTGCGINPDMTEQIFERLFQASDPAQAGRRGLGLGLHICKELVTRQGGRIWAENAPGQGAVLSVTLPVFSMRNLLAPTLKVTNGATGPLMLMVAQIVSPAGWLSDAARAEHSLGAREMLQRCLLSDQDVLLPKMGSSGGAELFFVVVATDPDGCEALIKRFRQQFDERELEQKAGLTLSTSCRTVETTRRNKSDPKGASFEWVAATFQALVNEELSSRMVANG
ncbi:MAG TPA: hybrid sensor histidine kinase/response regulator [Steroidobacteraceae bacterium]|nr:hybrid sensor histidine kinase/response regulator [Steroidobacteraceae bacterium]